MPINPDDLLLVSRGGSDYKYPADSFVGEKGDTGENGEGVASGGLTGQILAKASDTSFDTTWHNLDTENLLLTNPITRSVFSLPDTGSLTNQSELNNWFHTAITEIEAGAVGQDKRLPYKLETNRTGGGTGGHPGGEIQLVDAEDNFTNVTFDGTNGITTSATAAGITVDGSVLTQGIENLSLATAVQLNSLDSEIGTVENRVDGLETKVDALEGVVGQANFECDLLSGTSARAGDWIPLKGTLGALDVATSWAETTYVTFSTTDADGNNFDFSSAVPGDVIRLHIEGDVTMDISAFEFVIATVAGGVFEVGQVVKAVNAPTHNATYNMTHLSSFDPSGLATIDYVDGQDALKLNLTGGQMTGGITFKENDQAIRISDGKKLRFIGTDGSGGNRTFVVLQNSDSTGTAAVDYKLNLYHVAYPTEDNHGANKKYVDDEIGKIVITGDYLPLTGGTLTGSLTFSGGAMIKPASSGQTVLDGRGSIGIRALADYPVVIESGSSYKTTLAIYGYNSNETGNRGKVIDMQADGKITTKNNFVTSGLIKTTRNTGYGIEVKPDDGTTVAYINTAGKVNCRTFEMSFDQPDNTKFFKIKGRIQDGTESTDFFHFFRNSGGTADAVNYGGRTSAGSTNVATCKYVDDAIASNVSPGVAVNRPPGLRFAFGNGTTTVVGTAFNYYDSGGLKMRISKLSKDVTWMNSARVEDYNLGTKIYFTIYWIDDSSNNKWNIVRTGVISRIDYHTSDILCYVDNHKTNGSLSTSRDYYITIGGLF